MFSVLFGLYTSKCQGVRVLLSGLLQVGPHSSRTVRFVGEDACTAPNCKVKLHNLGIQSRDTHMMSVAQLLQQQQHSSSSTAAAAQQQWWWLLRRVAVFGPSTPDQTRTPNEENGTPKRDFFSGFSCGLCIAHQHGRSSSAMHRGSWNSRSSSTAAAAQEQQHRSSSTAAAAQQQRWQRRRGYGRKGRAWIHR